jgi:hypothetical protein
VQVEVGLQVRLVEADVCLICAVFGKLAVQVSAVVDRVAEKADARPV